MSNWSHEYCAEMEEDDYDVERGGETECDDEHGEDGDEPQFADPGGNSALRASSARNPRNLPCPNCGVPNRLTPADKARGYQCDACADAAERGGDY